jgi:hypothetical protein
MTPNAGDLGALQGNIVLHHSPHRLARRQPSFPIHPFAQLDLAFIREQRRSVRCRLWFRRDSGGAEDYRKDFTEKLRRCHTCYVR